MEQGKLVKAEVADKSYDAAALVTICRFNFLLRRSFIQWLHADLRAIGAVLNQLEKRGMSAIDCRSAGFSSKEPISKLRQFHQHWKPPFQTDYSQNSAFQPYEQLMSLRQDLENALGPAVPSAAPISTPAVKKEIARDNRPSAESARNTKPTERVTPSAATRSVRCAALTRKTPGPDGGHPADCCRSRSDSVHGPGASQHRSGRR